LTKYPKLAIEKWINAKLTIKERDEIDYYVNHAGWSLKRVAEMYHVSQHTARYWSDPEFKRIDNLRTGIRMKRKMENPVYRQGIEERRKARTEKRMVEEPMYRAWVKTGWKEGYRSKYDSRTDEAVENGKASSRKYYRGHVENARERGRRSYRAKDLIGFRMFQKRINRVSYADNICHSKKETRSTKSYKTLDVSPMKSHLPMVRKLHTSLLSISRKMLRPISVLKRVFSIRS